MAEFGKPQSRNEAILENILGASNPLGEPQSRIEYLLQQILETGGMGGKLIAEYDDGTVTLSVGGEK